MSAVQTTASQIRSTGSDQLAMRRVLRASALADTPMRTRRRAGGGFGFPQYERRTFGFIAA